MRRPRLRAPADPWLAALLLAACLVEVAAWAAVDSPVPGRAVAGGVLASLLTAGPVALRARRPLLAALVSATALLAAAAVAGTPPWAGEAAPFTAMLPVGLVAFTAGDRLPLRPALAALAAMVVLLEGADIGWGDGDPVPVFITVGPWLAGRTVGARRVLAERLAELAAELEREREAYAGLAVLRERRRIARELHDVVAHALSLIVIQSAAGRLLLDEDPAAARESLGAIREAAGQAAQDTERLHALLDERTPRGLAQLPALLGPAAASGLRVTLDAPPAPAVAPPAQDAAYRLVQEALTNVAKHAPGADVHIRATVVHDGLEVEVANGPARRPRGALHAAGAGQGLPGMRERVLAAGGDLSAGPAPGGGWMVRARLPTGMPAAPALTPAGSAR